MYIVAERPDLGCEMKLVGGIPFYIANHVNVPSNVEEAIDNLSQKIPENLTEPIGWSCNTRTTFFEYKKKMGEITKILHPLLKYLHNDVHAHLEFLDFDFDNYNWTYDYWWGNKYKNGEFQESHNHLNNGITEFTILSLIYYPKKSDSHLLLLHLKENVDLDKKYFFPVKEYNDINNYNLQSHGFYPDKDHTLIIFPSYLDHSVKWVKNTEEERMSISTNIIIKKKDRTDESSYGY